MNDSSPVIFTIFGGTGDLAYRKLYPALYELYRKKRLNPQFAVIGTARRPWTDEHYRQVVIDSVNEHSDDNEEATEFASHFYYQSLDVTDSSNYDQLKDLLEKLDRKYHAENNRVFYFSVSPSLFGVISQRLKSQDLVSPNGFNRIVIEKPFGSNYETSKQLNDTMTQTFAEEQIYRVDHYLGKELVQTILPFRFSNTMIQSLWDNQSIQSIKITLNESIGVEDRGAYYDHAGALRDMFQNHIMQLISLLLMKEPASLSGEAISSAKAAALKQLVQYSPKEVKDNIIRGQYIKNTEGNAKGYRSERDVDPQSMTETFIGGKVYSHDPQWHDVPIYFKTGKRLENKETRIDLTLKPPHSSPYYSADKKSLPTNRISFLIDPEKKISFIINGKETAEHQLPTPLELTSDSSDSAGDYETLIDHVLHGDRAHFVHWEELAVSWKFVDHILDSWEDERAPLYDYPAGSRGPEAYFEL